MHRLGSAARRVRSRALCASSTPTAKQTVVVQGERSWTVRVDEKGQAVWEPAATAAPASPTRRLRDLSLKMLQFLLPSGYPDTVDPSYRKYAVLHSVAAVASSAGGGACAGRSPRWARYPNGAVCRVHVTQSSPCRAYCTRWGWGARRCPSPPR